MSTTATTYRYGLYYRPAAFPRSFPEWRLVERGTLGSYPRRTDLPDGRFPHGVIETDEPLDHDTRIAYELEPC